MNISRTYRQLSYLYAKEPKTSAGLFLGTRYDCFVFFSPYETFCGEKQKKFAKFEDKVMTFMVIIRPT